MNPNGTRTFSDIETLIRELNAGLNTSSRANCFNAIELYWKDSQSQKFLGPEEFVGYVSKNFKQISSNEDLSSDDVVIIWSRTNTLLPVGQIVVDDLLKKQEGYPFGLVIEHSFVVVDEENVFEKPDPKSSSLYQIVSGEAVLAPYRKLDGFELTRHRRL